VSSGTSSDTMSQFKTRAECENAGGKWSAVSSQCSAKESK
jgi:hypothetical protein